MQMDELRILVVHYVCYCYGNYDIFILSFIHKKEHSCVAFHFGGFATDASLYLRALRIASPNLATPKPTHKPLHKQNTPGDANG